MGEVTLLGNALLGSDPEGDDQELAGTLATLLRINRVLLLGLDARFRALLTTDGKRIGTTVVDRELAILPGAVLMIGRLVLVGEAGFTGFQQTRLAGQPDEQQSLRTGVLIMSGVGAGF